jgi:hypothetical protein
MYFQITFVQFPQRKLALNLYSLEHNHTHNFYTGFVDKISTVGFGCMALEKIVANGYGGMLI